MDVVWGACAALVVLHDEMNGDVMLLALPWSLSHSALDVGRTHEYPL